MTSVISALMTIIVNLSFDVFCIKLFFDVILSVRNEKIPLPFYWLSLFLSELLLTAHTYWFSGIFSQQKVITTVLLSLSLLFMLSFLYHSNLFTRLLACFIFEIYGILGEYFVYVCMNRFLSYSDNQLYNLAIDNVLNFISELFLLLFILLTNLFWKKSIRRFPIQYHISILATPIISIFILLAFSQQVIDNRNPFFTLISICCLMLLNILNYYLLQNILANQNLRTQNQLLCQQISSQRDNYDQISAAYRNTRRLIHETKRQFFYLQTCIQQGKYDELLSSLKQFIGDLEHQFITVNTGNLVIDSLISNYSCMANENDIIFRKNITIQKERIITSDYDLCVMLGNLLENSYHACLKQPKDTERFINITIVTKDHNFVIEIINSCLPDTTAVTSLSLDHGFGTENVRIITEQNRGIFSVSTEDGTYHAVIIIPIPLNI